MAHLVVASVGDAKARAKVDLTAPLNSLAATEEGGPRSKVEATRLVAELARLETEPALLFLELKMS